MFFVNYSCKKISDQEKKSEINNNASGANQPNTGKPPTGSSCAEELEPDGIDSVLTPTILGYQLSGNPYSVANMQQASINLYGNNGGIVANKKYVWFKPANETQLQILAESNLDLFDYPLDRDVIQEGDYYPQTGIGEEEIAWLYTVVDINYQPPSGIQYEILQQIYVPDNDIWLEEEALRITNNPINESCGAIPNLVAPPCDDPCNPGPGCPPPPPECGGGGGNPPPPDPRKPSGVITVWDSNFGTEVPVRRTRVLARRWFKIEPVYTNDQGQFQCKKRFRNKVNIFVKFLNNNITIHGLRSAKVWQMWFPIKKGIGIYSGNLNNIHYVFLQNTFQPHSRTNRNWWAAQTMNSQVEYNEMAAANNVGGLPSFMRLLLTGWANARGSGSTPMNYHRNGFNQFITPELIQFFIVDPVTIQRAIVYNWLYNGLFLRQTDMSLGYDKNWDSDDVKALTYHEMGHAAHFNVVGIDWWNSLVFAEAYETARFGTNDQRSPYGIGDDGDISGLIALAESWAEHIGRTMTETRYGVTSSNQLNQGIEYTNNFPVIGLNTHNNLLEDFSPDRTNDFFRWIPYGIYYDLNDNRNDNLAIPTRVFVEDQVAGYTNQQFFNALGQDIVSIPGFRARLLFQNGNNQLAEVNLLFNGYHY